MHRHSTYKFFLLIVMTCVAMTLGCSSSPEDSVKNGVLKIEPSVTVGDAFNGYKYFSTKEWKAFKDSQNRQIVEFRGKVDIDKYSGTSLPLVGTLTKEKIKRAKEKLGNPVFTYVAQFVVYKNGKTFELRYNGVHISRMDARTGKKKEDDVPFLFLFNLGAVYKNSPLPYVFNVLLRNSKK